MGTAYDDMYDGMGWDKPDSSVPYDIEKEWDENTWKKVKKNTTDFAIVLKAGERFKAVADAKNYLKSTLNQAQIDKLLIDASMLGSEMCYIIVPNQSAVNRIKDAQFWESDYSIYIYKLIKYEVPELSLDRDICNSTITTFMQQNSIYRK